MCTFTHKYGWAALEGRSPACIEITADCLSIIAAQVSATQEAMQDDFLDEDKYSVSLTMTAKEMKEQDSLPENWLCKYSPRFEKCYYFLVSETGVQTDDATWI